MKITGTLLAALFAAASSSAWADLFTNGSFARCCWDPTLGNVGLSDISQLTNSEPASLTLFGFGLSLMAVRYRATHHYKTGETASHHLRRIQ